MTWFNEHMATTTDTLHRTIELFPDHFLDGLHSTTPRDLDDAVQSLQFHLEQNPDSILVAYAAGQLAHALQQFT